MQINVSMSDGGGSVGQTFSPGRGKILRNGVKVLADNSVDKQERNSSLVVGYLWLIPSATLRMPEVKLFRRSRRSKAVKAIVLKRADKNKQTLLYSLGSFLVVAQIVQTYARRFSFWSSYPKELKASYGWCPIEIYLYCREKCFNKSVRQRVK